MAGLRRAAPRETRRSAGRSNRGSPRASPPSRRVGDQRPQSGVVLLGGVELGSRLPTTIYISTPYDPRDDTTKSSKREIWRGTTCDNGATFKWTPVTANSTKDNIRPIVPKWDGSHTALLWMQGSYMTAQGYSMAIVGVLTTKP